MNWSEDEPVTHREVETFFIIGFGVVAWMVIVIQPLSPDTIVGANLVATLTGFYAGLSYRNELRKIRRA